MAVNISFPHRNQHILFKQRNYSLPFGYFLFTLSFVRNLEENKSFVKKIERNKQDEFFNGRQTR